MLPCGGGAGALEQPGQQREDARRVAAGGGRLAGGQADLALGHRDPGEAVHHQHDVPAAVAEPLGDPGGDEGRAQPLDRRVRRRWRRRRPSGARPSGPRSFSRNSRTSRPRSPTSAITEISASVPRAIIESRLDLPTPEPAMMPRRWPRPHGTSVSSARTPRPSWRSMRGRLSAVRGGVLDRDQRRGRSSGGPPSIGRPRPSSTRPRSASPTPDRSGPPVCRTRAPTRRPVVSPERQAGEPAAGRWRRPRPARRRRGRGSRPGRRPRPRAR